jgi:thymidylate synthase (FAD)
MTKIPENLLQFIELCGRVCYKSEERITPTSSEALVRGIIKNGHESVLEHYSITVRFICDRGVTHEKVRHRIAAYSQESTRYCNYGNHEMVFLDAFAGLVCPNADKIREVFDRSCRQDEENYKELLSLGVAPQMARSVLPNCLKTEIIMTANLREWRHFFKLRCSGKAHPQMRQVSIPLLQYLQSVVPLIFDGIEFVVPDMPLAKMVTEVA